MLLSFAAIVIGSAFAVSPTPEDMNAAETWVKSAFSGGAVNCPFSFSINDASSADLLGKWKTEHTSELTEPNQVNDSYVFTDPETGLQVRLNAIAYTDFPTVEWTMYFKNTGTKDTKPISKIFPLDMQMRRQEGKEYVLHHAQGSLANKGDYGPRETTLSANARKVLRGTNGRPTGEDWAYWNLDWSDAGIIVAVGWPGQWAAEIARNSTDAIHMRAGQEVTNFVLHPGEEVRTPRIVLQFWKGGDWLRAQNVWHRWMMAHNMPHPGGKLPPPQLVASSSRAYEEMIKADTEKQIMFIDRFLEENIKLDYWWMDAGWYVQQKGWPQVGTWEVDPARFPNGLRPISDHAHAKGIKILVWFEPERVAPDTWLAKNHPEWLLRGSGDAILNLGNDETRQWLTDHVDKLLVDQGIDLYRQDFNIEPLSAWRGNDSDDRQGITEIRHVTGYLAYWDELRKRHPDMLIDSCASGGRRNDVETMRRAVPLWRSDYAYEPIGHQCMTYGISLWLPYHGTGTVACAKAEYYGGGLTPIEPYAFWSNVAPSLGLGIDVRVKEIDYEALRELIKQWRQMSEYYYADYYPLTSYSQDPRNWIAWQFNDPDKNSGVVQAFRREKCEAAVARLRLHDLDEEATYSFAYIGNPDTTHYKGKDLVKAGLPVTINDLPGAAVLMYKKI